MISLFKFVIIILRFDSTLVGKPSKENNWEKNSYAPIMEMW